MYPLTDRNPGTLVISLDFELHWGVRDTRSVAECRAKFDGVYAAIPELLRVFDQWRIHATWATVGMLFFETKREFLACLPVMQPNYVRRELSPYLDFDGLGDDYREDPYHFAPTLVRMIADSVNQEIGTHTFSHYYCLENGQTVDEFQSDLEAAIVTAKRYGIVLKSIVFPRNQYSSSHLEICNRLGFNAYRGNPQDWFWRPRKASEDGLTRRAFRLLDAHLPISGHNCWNTPQVPAGDHLVNVRASRVLRPVGKEITSLDSLRLHRIKTDMAYAAHRGRVYHLWWHPENFGIHLAPNLEFLGIILEWFDHLRRSEGMQSLNMGELAEAVRTAREPRIE